MSEEDAMEIMCGTVVKSIAGHDGGSFYVALSASESCAVIADGKQRTLQKPKKKNLRHLAGTNIVLNPDEFSTNKKLRHILWPYNHGGETPVYRSEREVK